MSRHPGHLIALENSGEYAGIKVRRIEGIYEINEIKVH